MQSKTNGAFEMMLQCIQIEKHDEKQVFKSGLFFIGMDYRDGIKHIAIRKMWRRELCLCV